MGGLADPAGMAVMALVGLVALRFGIGWLLTSVLLRLLLRPIPLFLIAVAAAAALNLG